MIVFKLKSFVAPKLLGFSNHILQSKIRHYSSKRHDDFELVYSLNYARIGASVNSLKLKQTILAGLAYPACLALELQNFVPHGTYSVPCLFIAAGFHIGFYSIGQLFYGLVGKVYWNEKTQLVKIAYVGFFGKREELIVPIDDITSIEDKRSGVLYTRFEVYESKETPKKNKPTRRLKINEQYYDFGDLDLISRIFGGGFGSR